MIDSYKEIEINYELKNLEIKIGNSNDIEDDIASLDKEVKRLVNLETLKITFVDKMAENECKKIADILKKMTKLKSFTLNGSNNPIGDEGGKHIAAALASLTGLT